MLKKAFNNNRIAVIDLGSNTFHLLIVEEQDGIAPFFKVIFRKRKFVYALGQNSNSFGREQKERAISCINEFQHILVLYGVTKVLPAATAAFRMALNGQELIDKLQSVLMKPINILSGLKEAEYIYKGISLMPLSFDQTNLIMDIGGGSVELILSKNNEIKLIQSFKTGISFLRHNFKMSEPISFSERLTVNKYLDSQLSFFIESLRSHSPTQLIGSSGPFEILENLNGLNSNIKGNNFKRQEVLHQCQKITSLSLKERLKIEHMPSTRADLSKESFLLLEHILKSIKTIQNVCVSPFGLKEGIIANELNLV